MFKVIVPCKQRKVRGRFITSVSYPSSGHSLYTRQEAIDLLKTLYNRCPWDEGGEREAWAESDSERFTLHYPVNLVQGTNTGVTTKTL